MSGLGLRERSVCVWMLCAIAIVSASALSLAHQKMSHVDEPDSATSKDAGKVYIVYMEKTDDEPEALESKHMETLASVLGSQEAAKDAILYSYKHGINGFSAKLTTNQVSSLSEKPGVIQVVPSQVYKLHEVHPATTGSV